MLAFNYSNCTECGGSPYVIHDCLPDSQPMLLCMDAWIISQLNVASIRKLRGSLMWLVYFSNILSINVYITWHSQTSDHLVQELHVSTVCAASTMMLSPLQSSGAYQKIMFFTYCRMVGSASCRKHSLAPRIEGLLLDYV